MKIISKDLRDGEKLPERHVFNGMGYQGDNISPHLAWDEVPAGTKSFVVTCYDPDAPTGSGWWHWIVANLPADTRVLPQGSGSGLVALPEGAIQTRTDFGKAGYGGAAPPKGETHRYIFTVHALDVEKIDVDEGASGAMVGFNVHFHSRERVDYGDVFVKKAGWRLRLTRPGFRTRRPGKRSATGQKNHSTEGNSPTSRPSSRSCIALSISGAKKRSSS